MEIALTPDLEEFLKRELQTGKYPTAIAVIREGLRLLRDQENQGTLDDLRKDIAVGVAQADRGEVAPFKPVDTLTRIRQQKNTQP